MIFTTGRLGNILVLKNPVVFSHIKKMSIGPKRITGRYKRNAGWPVNQKIYGHRTLVIAKVLS